MRLLEREDLVQRLRLAVRAAAAGDGRLIAVCGEAGAGKSTLVAEALESEAAIWGYCEPLTTPRPLGPFRDVAGEIWSAEQGAQSLGVGEMRERLLQWFRTSPPPVVLEDAHWIDTASADVLRFLGRRLHTCPGLIILTFRDELGPDHPLRRVLGELANAPGFIRLEVPALSAAAVADLLGDVDIDAQEAYRLTSGNPFLVSQLANASDGPVAASLADSVQSRLAGLPATSRELVHLLSVVPGRVPVALISAEWAALDPAVVGGVLRVDGLTVEFRHELVRLAVEADLPPGRSQALHAEVLRRMLVLPGADPATVAFHARLAHDSERAWTYERAAARQAAELGSHREAAEHYRRLVTDAPPTWSSTEISQLWLDLSREEALIGRDGPAQDAARRAVQLRPVGTDPLQRGDAMRWWSRLSPAESEAHRRASMAVEILEPSGPTRELAAAYANFAMTRMLARDLPAAREWARRAIALAEELGDVASVVAGMEALGSAETVGGLDPQCLTLRQAVLIARDAGLEAELGRVYANLVSAAGEARLYELSLTEAAEALTYFTSRDLDANASYTRAWVVRCQFEQGRWRVATEGLESLLADIAGGPVHMAIAAFGVQGRLRARRGDPGVWEALDEAQRLASVTGTLQRIAPVSAAGAEARWLVGEHDDGESGLRESYELAVARSHPWWIGELGFWMWRHGLLDDVPDTAAEPYRLHVRGDYAAAAQRWLAIGCPYEAAEAWCDSSDVAEVTRALELYTELGADPGRQRAARRLRELGVRSIPRGPREATAADPDGLTGRQREVLLLVQDGRTDAEIAARLHLSARTVGHHVSAILQKLNVSSRRELLGARDRGPGQVR